MDLQGLHGQVVDRIGLSLTAGEHRAGDVLRLEDVQERYGVSRTVAREAARVLESKRVLRSRPRVGLTIRPMSEWNLYDPQVIRWRLASPNRSAQLRELAELRAAVEPSAAALAAATADRETRLVLLEHAEAMLRAADGVESGDADRGPFIEADVAFHRALLLASGNEMFAQLAEVIGELLVSRRELLLLPDHVNAEAVRQHREVAEAVLAGDRERAARCAGAVLDQARAEIEEILDGAAPAAQEPPADTAR